MQDPFAFACRGAGDSDEPVSALLAPHRTATQSQRRPNEAAQYGVQSTAYHHLLGSHWTRTLRQLELS